MPPTHGRWFWGSGQFVLLHLFAVSKRPKTDCLLCLYIYVSPLSLTFHPYAVVARDALAGLLELQHTLLSALQLIPQSEFGGGAGVLDVVALQAKSDRCSAEAVRALQELYQRHALAHPIFLLNG